MNSASHACIGVACCRRMMNGGSFHAVFEAYIKAFIGMRIVPVMIPAFGDDWPDTAWLPSLLARLDGLFLPGSPSNVHPANYGAQGLENKIFDRARDATTLPLIRAFVAAGMPVLAVCRGLQELNVALGGSLHPDVESRGFMRHRAQWPLDSPKRYDVAHSISISPSMRLASMLQKAGCETAAVQVNSLHAEGIDELAPDLVVEAFAEDGLVEAVSHHDRNRFVLGVQWHAEWRKSHPRIDELILSEFESACLAWRARASR